MNNTVALISIYNTNKLTIIDNFLCCLKNKPKIMLSINSSSVNKKLAYNFYHKHRKDVLDFSEHDNYGVDINPFLTQLSYLDAKLFPYFIKLHSKSSQWGTKMHVDWGYVLIHSLIGSNYIYQKNLEILSRKHVGMLAHNFLTLKDRELNNSNKIKHLLHHMDIPYDMVKNQFFAAGSMFFSKTELFQKYFTTEAMQYMQTVIATEVGKVDDRHYTNGSYCHAIERIFGYVVHANNSIIHPTIIPTFTIRNASAKKLHLVLMNNGYVYIQEDLNLYGKIIQLNDKQQQITIKWLHIEKTATYNFLSGYLIRHNYD